MLTIEQDQSQVPDAQTLQSALQDGGGTHSKGCPSESSGHSRVSIERCHLASCGSVPHSHRSVLTPCTTQACTVPFFTQSNDLAQQGEVRTAGITHISAVQRSPELMYWPSGLKLASHPVLSGPVLRRSVTLPLKASMIYSVPPATADISLPSGLKVTPRKGCALFASSGTCKHI